MLPFALIAFVLGPAFAGPGASGAPDVPSPPGLVVPRGVPASRGVPGAPVPSPPARSGADIEADARALLTEAQACEDSCEVVPLSTLAGPNSCVAVFQCSAALPPDLDRPAFSSAAKALAEEKRASGECAIASCMPPSQLEAVCVEGRCMLQPR